MPYDASRLLGITVLVLTVLLAGCAEPAGSITMRPVTDAELADAVSRTPPADSDGRPMAQRISRIVQDAVATGAATINESSPPIRDGLPFAYNGAYYNLSWTVTDQQAATVVDVKIDYAAAQDADHPVAYDDLPASDRKVMDTVLPPRERIQHDGYDIGAGVVLSDAEQNQSVLLHQPYDAIVYDGETYPIHVAEARNTTVNTYRYTATPVANSSAAYAQQLKQNYLFTLSGLSEREQAVVTDAIDGGYYAEETDDTAFQTVLDRFQQYEAVTQEKGDGEWLVKYDGEVYWVDLYYYQFAEG